MPCGIRSLPLRDLDQVVRIEERCRSLCGYERVPSVHVFRDRPSGGWASGNWDRTPVQGYTRSQLFRPAPLRAMCWWKDGWILMWKRSGKWTWVLLQVLRYRKTSFSPSVLKFILFPKYLSQKLTKTLHPEVVSCIILTSFILFLRKNFNMCTINIRRVYATNKNKVSIIIWSPTVFRV